MINCILENNVRLMPCQHHNYHALDYPLSKTGCFFIYTPNAPERISISGVVYASFG